uniref:Uncharacterized protein n=1 Tax=Plectus sambesii TaxID=2011161 RepID=A0A914WIU7_9BILA
MVASVSVERVKDLVAKIAEPQVDYAQFSNDASGNGVLQFEENAPQFRLFGTKIHVVFGALIAGVIGLIVTMIFCVMYTFFHNRGMGRNEFIDTLELIDLIFAFFVGLPCHYALFYGIHCENKRFLSPFLIFYCTNFALNCLFSVTTLAAAFLDVQRHLFGRVRFDFGWVFFQLGFISAQGLAIYVVMKCRKYLDAKEQYRKPASEQVLNQ